MKKTEIQRIIWATAGVFALLLLLYAVAAAHSFRRDSKQAAAHAELNAKVYTVELERDYERGIAVTEALEEVLVNG